MKTVEPPTALVVATALTWTTVLRAQEPVCPDQAATSDVTLALREGPAFQEAWHQRVLIESQTGAHAPLGVAGVAVGVSPDPVFVMTFGAGVRRSPTAPQVGSSMRLRLLLTSAWAVGPEGGVTVGRYEEVASNTWGRAVVFSWDRAVWAHGGLMLERRLSDAWHLRGGFGVRAVLNVVDASCDACDPTDEPGVWTTTSPYAQLSLGWVVVP